jgi:hypothetical protein
MGCLLAIRRDRPDRATYWVLPGGHVDPGDQSLEAALSRTSIARALKADALCAGAHRAQRRNRRNSKHRAIG